MSALSLFDVASLTLEADNTESNSSRLILVADSMVASLVDRFKKIEELDEAFARSEIDANETVFDVGTAMALRSMYQECARDAEDVFARIERIERRGQKVKLAGTLRDLYGRAKAMLSVSLEEIGKSLEDVRQGNVISGEEVRRELRGRIHS